MFHRGACPKGRPRMHREGFECTRASTRVGCRGCARAPHGALVGGTTLLSENFEYSSVSGEVFWVWLLYRRRYLSVQHQENCAPFPATDAQKGDQACPPGSIFWELSS